MISVLLMLILIGMIVHDHRKVMKELKETRSKYVR